MKWETLSGFDKLDAGVASLWVHPSGSWQVLDRRRGLVAKGDAGGRAAAAQAARAWADNVRAEVYAATATQTGCRCGVVGGYTLDGARCARPHGERCGLPTPAGAEFCRGCEGA